MLESRNEDFYSKLSVILNIMKEKPDSIVDDTAIERLLDLLDNTSRQKHSEFYDTCLLFLSSEKIWKNEAALSFALRISGYLGRDFISLKDNLPRSIILIFEKVIDHSLFHQAVVKYGFFNGLASLVETIEWLDYVQIFLRPTMIAFQENCMYVRKAAVKYLACYLRCVVKNQKDLKEFRNEMVFVKVEKLQHVVDAVLQLLKGSFEECLTFLYQSNLLWFVMKEIKETLEAHTGLLVSFINLVDLLISAQHLVDWERLIHHDEDEIQKTFEEFLQLVCSRPLYKDQTPELNEAFIFRTKTPSCFSNSWNADRINSLLEPAMGNADTLLKGSEWKKLFVVTISCACKIHRKIYNDVACVKIIKDWTRFCLRLLLISLNKFSDSIAEHLYCVIDDKKITRLCFQYLNSLVLSDLPEKVVEDILSTLWVCVSSLAVNTQTICLALDLLTKLVTLNDSHFVTLQIIETIQERHQNTNTLAEVLSLRLSDMNWEVKDSLLSFLLCLVKSAKIGSRSLQNFLEKYNFWCASVEMLTDHESYVRAKCVTFLAEVYGSSSLWDILLTNKNLEKDFLWTNFHRIITDASLLDDMFTRRDILQAIRRIVQYKGFLEANANSNFGDKDVFDNFIYPILLNASQDLDWELRKLCYVVWTDILSEFQKIENIKFHSVVRMLIDTGFWRVIIETLLEDTEIEVRRSSLMCIEFLKTMKKDLHEKDDFFENVMNEPPHAKKSKVSNISELHSPLEDLIGFLQKYSNQELKLSSDTFIDFLKQLDTKSILESMEEIDVSVKKDPSSFLHDIICSTQPHEGNLLDCY